MSSSDGEEGVPPILTAQAEVVRLRSQLRRAERRIAELESLVDAVRRVQTWDVSVYGEPPDGEWLAIDRERYHDLARCLTGVVQWRPWHMPLETRLEMQ